MVDTRTTLILTLAALFAPPATAAAQLRPMETVPWRNGPETSVMVGASAYGGARVPMAGLEGTLYEAAVLQASAAFGRAAVRVQAARHVFDPATRYTAPAAGVRDKGLDRLADFADVTLETLLYFATPDWLMAGMRLGSRVPSSDNEVGLDRDRADVYGTFMLGGGGETVWVETEAGVGVHGSRRDDLEQQDPFPIPHSCARAAARSPPGSGSSATSSGPTIGPHAATRTWASGARGSGWDTAPSSTPPPSGGSPPPARTGGSGSGWDDGSVVRGLMESGHHTRGR